MAKLYWRMKINGKWTWRRQHLPHPFNPEVYNMCECPTCMDRVTEYGLEVHEEEE